MKTWTMIQRLITTLTLVAAQGSLVAHAQTGYVRGMQGDPVYQSAYYQPNYQAYQPVQAYYPGTAYGQPVYGQPNYAQYQAAYQANYAPQYAGVASAAYYPPQGYAQSNYSAPVYSAPTYGTTRYSAPTAAYRISLPGAGGTGGEAYAAYAQASAIAYAPQQAYRPAMATQMVYLRPVTVYNPMTAQQVTYYAPCTGNTCYQGAAAVAPVAPVGGCGAAPSCAPANTGCNRGGWFSNCRLFNGTLFNGGLFRRNTCYSSGCALTTCGTAPCGTQYTGIPSGCGQPAAVPYYTPGTIPVNPGVGLPPTTYTPVGPSTPPRGGLGGINAFPGLNTRIQPPPTRMPGSVGVPNGTSTNPGTFGGNAADTAPSLNSSGGFAPGSAPATQPPTGFPGSNYPPAADQSRSRFGTGGASAGAVIRSTVQPAENAYQNRIILQPPVSGDASTPNSSSMIRESGTQKFRSVQPIADPDTQRKPAATNRAPQLLDPRDRTASRAGNGFDVVPAKWPAANPARATAYRELALHSPAAVTEPAKATVRAVSVQDEMPLDDSGWHSAR